MESRLVHSVCRLQRSHIWNTETHPNTSNLNTSNIIKITLILRLLNMSLRLFVFNKLTMTLLMCFA